MNSNESKVRYVSAKDSKGLQDMVLKAIAAYGKGRVAVQVAIVAILVHAAKHGDYTQASALVNGLGGKTARDVAQFFRDFGGLEAKPDEDGKTPDEFNAWQGAEYILADMGDGKTRLDHAKATMYWQHKQPKDSAFIEYSLEKMAQELLDRHAKAAKKAKDGKAKLDDTMTEGTRQAVLRLVQFEELAKAA